MFLLQTEIENFYQSLTDTITQIPGHNMVITVGDFNAKIEHPEALYSFNTYQPSAMVKCYVT